MFKYLLFVVVIYITSNGYSQYDWTYGSFVFQNGDTLEGLIKIPLHTRRLLSFHHREKVQFKLNENSEIYKYKEKDVKRLIFKPSHYYTEYFEYVTVSKRKKCLFQIVEEGGTILYKRRVLKIIHSSTYDGVGYSQVYGSVGVQTSGKREVKGIDEYFVLSKNETIASPLISAPTLFLFRKRARKYFSDCPEIVSKLTDKSYKSGHVIEIVKLYNKCH